MFSVLFIPSSSSTCTVFVSELRSLGDVMNYEELMNPQANEATGMQPWECSGTSYKLPDSKLCTYQCSFSPKHSLQRYCHNFSVESSCIIFVRLTIMYCQEKLILILHSTPESWCLKSMFYFCNFTFIGILLRRAAYNSSKYFVSCPSVHGPREHNCPDLRLGDYR